jgi:hypothetical protein
MEIKGVGEFAEQAWRTIYSKTEFIRGLEWAVLAENKEYQDGNWFSLFLVCYELEDQMSCQCHFTLRICAQNSNAVTFTKNASNIFMRNGLGWGYIKFMSFDDLWSKGFIHNDTIKVEIDAFPDPVKFNQ